MGFHALSEAELGLEVASELVGELDAAVNLGLEGLALVRGFYSLGNSGEKFVLAALLGCSSTGEGGVSDSVYLANLDLGGGGNNVGLVYALKRYTVDAVRTSDKKGAGVELFKEDNTLATEAVFFCPSMPV